MKHPESSSTTEPLLESRGRSSGTTGNYSRRRHELRSRSPESAAQVQLATRKKYLLAGLCLALSLVTFVFQTESVYYIQDELGYSKPYLML